MRILAILAIALVGSTLNCAAQKILVKSGELRSNIFETQNIVVGPGQLIEIIDFFTTDPRVPSSPGRDARLETQAGEEFKLVQARSWTGVPLGNQRTIKLIGDLQVRVRAEVGSHVQYYLYYRIIDNVETAATQTSQTGRC